MIRRIVTVLALVVPCVTIAATTAQPAQADISTQQSASATAAGRLASGFKGTASNGTWDFQNANPTDGCTTQTTGTCWWWTAIALNSLVTYAEDHPNDSTDGTIHSDLVTVYQNVCAAGPGPCPDTADETLYAGPFIENSNGNVSYDDIGWWTQTWINAYRWSCNSIYYSGCDKRYLYLAEGLWYYTTRWGWNKTCGGLVQEQYTVDTNRTNSSNDDAEANAPYLRNSAWLYSLSGDEDQYMNGWDFTKGIAGGPGAKGGAFADWQGIFTNKANISTRDDLISPVSGTMGDSGARWLVRDHVVDATCQADFQNKAGGANAQSWLMIEGETVSALSELSISATEYCTHHYCQVINPNDYNTDATELALTVVDEVMTSAGTWPNQTVEGLTIEPLVDAKTAVNPQGILSEPCNSSGWPVCDAGSLPNWTIGKGLFEMGVYCLTQKKTNPVSQLQLSSFVKSNADSIAANDTDFGFVWDYGTWTTTIPDTTNAGTVATALDGLDASIGTSTSMC